MAHVGEPATCVQRCPGQHLLLLRQPVDSQARGSGFTDSRNGCAASARQKGASHMSLFSSPFPLRAPLAVETAPKGLRPRNPPSRVKMNVCPNGVGSPRRHRRARQSRECGRPAPASAGGRRPTWRRPQAPLAATFSRQAPCSITSARMVDSLRQLCYANQATQQHGAADRCEGRA